MNSFQRIYEAARMRHADKWSTLPPTRITETIYHEMRRLDAEVVRVAKEKAAHSAHEITYKKDTVEA